MVIYLNGIQGVIIILTIYKIIRCEGVGPTWVPSQFDPSDD